MVKKRAQKYRKSGGMDSSKHNPEKSVGKSLLARLKEFREKGR